MPRTVFALRTTVPLAALVLAAACADQTVTDPAASPAAIKAVGRAGVSVPARYVVQFARTAPVNLPSAAVAASGGHVVGAVAVARGVVVASVTNPAALAAVAGVTRVEESPDILLDPGLPADGALANGLTAATGARVAASAASTPGDGVNPATASWVRSGVQWDLNSMRVPDAWKIASRLGAGARVCIIDSGLDGVHRELKGALVDSTSFVQNDTADVAKGYSSPGLDSVGHGTHVSGSVAARGFVMAGIAPRASLMIAKVFAATGGTPTDRVVNAMTWCTDHGADVINMSLGATRYKNVPSNVADIAFFQSGVDYATSNGVVVVASAGNSNVQVPNPIQTFAPAFARGVVSVGATGPLSKFPLRDQIPSWNPTDTAQVWRTADSRAYYSNFGSDVTVFAPGGNLGFNLAWPFRFYHGTLQGSNLDGIYSVCASSSQEFQPWLDSTGVPVLQGAQQCAGLANTYTTIQGTSMASPHAAGLMALVTAEIGGARTAARQQRVMSCVTRSADNVGPSNTFGGGRVNALRAIQLVRNGGC